MIDHEVTIGGIDVSAEVISITVQDQIDSESDPGKITIKLVNRPSKYSTVEAWTPQTTPIKIILKNWVYGSDKDDSDKDDSDKEREAEEREAAGGHAEQTYLVAYGHMTDCSRSSSEIVVTGECDLGHLADAIGDEYNHLSLVGTSKEILEKVLYYHNPPPDAWYNARIIRYDKAKNYNSETTFQEVLEDIANDVGAVYYYSADGILQFRDPTSVGELYDLDPYIINPDDTKSIMGYCNIVKVIADETLADSEEGRETPGSNPIQYTAQDEESIAEFGELVAPTDRAVWIGTPDECRKRAELLLNFYRLFKNALTKPKVAGIVPPLHSMVSYSVFIPIAEGEAISGTVKGTVVARSIDYSIEGLECELTVSRGVTDMTSYVGDEEIADAALTYGEED